MAVPVAEIYIASFGSGVHSLYFMNVEIMVWDECRWMVRGLCSRANALSYYDRIPIPVPGDDATDLQRSPTRRQRGQSIAVALR